MTGQKHTFLDSEGDAWFQRNEAALTSSDWSTDPVCREVQKLASGRKLKILEIGCGDASRLEYLKRTHGHEGFGVDPSAKAVARAESRGIHTVRTTADVLPFEDAAFDVVVFGFCLYLCDDQDLFRIAHEAHRVLAEPGWMLILDFDSPAPVYRPYHHVPGMVSRKMDYKSMFLWHPAYTLTAYEKFHHATRQWTDEAGEWVSLACLRKHLPPR